MRTDIEYVRSLEARLEELRTAADQADAEYRSEIDILREQVAEIRLTEAEQLAVAWAAREADEWDEEDTPEVAAHADALRGLARRLF
jgi:hypothetical protein